MIDVVIYEHEGGYAGFKAEGHAGYAESGQDIICAAVSVLTINAVNSIEALTGDPVEAEEMDGFLSCSFPQGLSAEGSLLMDSMILGLRQVAEIEEAESEERFLNVIITEV